MENHTVLCKLSAIFWQGSFVLLLAAMAVSNAVADSVAVPARELACKSPNVVPVEQNWDGLVVCHGKDGMQQWEFEIRSPGPHFVHFQFASGENRPVHLFVNDKKEQGRFLNLATGGFFAWDLDWQTCGPFPLIQGKNTIRLEAAGGFMPHLAGLVVSESETDWNKRAFELLFPVRPDLAGNVDEDTAATRGRLQELLPGVKQILFVKRYTFQSTHYYTDFIDGCQHFGSNLCLLSLDDGTVTEVVPELAHGIIGRCDLSYDGKRVLFDWKEKIGVGFRIWEVGIDGTGLRQVTFPPDDEEQRIDKYRLAEKTAYMHHTDDMHPCYLPDGGIAFASTRCEYGILCDGADRLTSSVIYRMDAGGGNMQKLSNNSVSESAPTVMNDGRILYTRWEYVDNGSVTNKALWAMRPDGTGSEEVYGMSVAFPSVFNVGRAVPGTNNLFVAIGAPHMPLGVGTVMLVDSRADHRTGEGVDYVTPEVDTQHQWGWDNLPGGATKPVPPEMQEGRDGRGNTSRGPLYMDPYPLSPECFLVSFNPRESWNVENAYGLYLLGPDGVKRLLHKESEHSCWMPIPVRSRSKPGIPRATIEPELASRGLARVVVSDVYRGLDGVERGAIKYLRINEHVPRPWASRRFWEGDVYDQQHSVVSCNAALGVRVQYGIVPVEEDGSAHFFVEADKNVFFQALDADFVEVQRERTFVNYRPGEVRSCVGCHERAKDNNAAEMATLPVALTRPPSVPGPQPGEDSGARPLSYEVDVQPVWDRHCVSCHNGSKKDGDLDLTGERTRLFCNSYENILSRGLISIIGENHPKAGNNHYLPPYSLGAHASKLSKYLTKDHYEVKLSPEERIRITTWIDSNGQYYGSYYGRKNLQFAGHPNFRPVLTFQQSRANTPPRPEEER
jgi:hypothetical protein